MGGQFENLQEASASLAVLVPLALLLIFVLLYSAFGSLKLATLIYLNVPLAITGGRTGRRKSKSGPSRADEVVRAPRAAAAVRTWWEIASLDSFHGSLVPSDASSEHGLAEFNRFLRCKRCDGYGVLVCDHRP